MGLKLYRVFQMNGHNKYGTYQFTPAEMKLITTISLLILIATSSFAQELKTPSDLRVKVDSIIRFPTNYVVDSTANLVPAYKWNSTALKSQYPSFSRLPPNPMAKIILNTKPIKVENLDAYELEDVDYIKVFPKNDPTAIALYGSIAKNGLIVIRLK